LRLEYENWKQARKIFSTGAFQEMVNQAGQLHLTVKGLSDESNV